MKLSYFFKKWEKIGDFIFKINLLCYFFVINGNFLNFTSFFMTPNKEEKLRDLLIQALGGDQNAYRTFLIEIIPILRAFLSKKVQNSSDVEDLIQETLISIHKALHTYNRNLSVFKWIFAISYRRYVDFIRKNSKREKIKIQVETIADFPTNREKELIKQYEQNNRIESVLSLLNEKEQRIFRMLKIEKFSIKEASKLLNLSENALKVAAHRIYKKIKNLIQQKEL